MAKFTRALRQEILDDFLRHNNGWFDPAVFVDYVRAQGPDHPAFEWFTWDDEEAARQHRIEEARRFARGLRIFFEVHTIERGSFTVSAPQMISPVEKRSDGGGYHRLDGGDPEHLAELSRQAARDLGWILRRYEAALIAVGADLDQLRSLQASLERGPVADEDAA